MSFDHEVFDDLQLIIIRGRGQGGAADGLDSARRLLDAGVAASYRLIFVLDGVTHNPSPEDLRAITQILRLIAIKFRGRKALVASQPGCVSIVRMLAISASTHDDFEAFTVEDVARDWVLAEPSR